MRYQNEVKTLIKQKYGKEINCAKQMNWTKQRLNRITTGRQEPNLEELQQFSNVLGCTIGEMAIIFLRLKSPNGQF